MSAVAESLEDKQERLSAGLARLPGLIVAYSGGVDSALLSEVAHEVLGDRTLAVTAVSPSLARRELAAAKELARRRGWNHRVVATREIARDEYARNEPDRCYWCKTELFEVLGPLADQLGWPVAVGTNADDLGDHRPGIAAASERGVLAPLAEAGLTKSEIRELSRRRGLPTADKPASPCLASRIAYGVRVTPQRLRRVERAEEFLRDLGFTVLRVRDHGDLARVEVAAEDIPRLAAQAGRVHRKLRDLGFAYVALDLGGFRSGSMNAVLAEPRIRPAP